MGGEKRQSQVMSFNAIQGTQWPILDQDYDPARVCGGVWYIDYG